MKFYTWEERREFLITLQELTISNQNADTFNVFAFGSFIRDDYKPGTSDIDLAVYAKDYKIARKIYNLLADYLEEKDVPYSLLLIDTDHIYDYVALQAVLQNVSFTDYSTDELQIFKTRSSIRLVWENEERARIKKLTEVVRRNFEKVDNENSN